MTPFAYLRPTSLPAALATGARHTSNDADVPGNDFFGGGTDLMQLMKEHVRNPAAVVDLAALPDMDDIVVGSDAIRLGARVTMSDAAAHAGLRAHAPVLGEALLASASPQVRNLATLGGNLLQRTRCGYFRDVALPCNKREPGSGCPAIDGLNRLHAILGTSEHCIATYAGDFANALVVVDADVVVAGPRGERRVAVADLHRPPGDAPHVETALDRGELIVAIEMRPRALARRSHYLKVRDRASFEWAIASAAVAMDLSEDLTVRDVRVAVGGVATRPWRLPAVEQALRGRRVTADLCREAGSLAAAGAVANGRNAYKIPLIRRTVARALEETAGLA